MRPALLLLALAMTASAAAQQSEAQPQSNVTVIPAPKAQSDFRFPKVEPVKTVDIPQWAKDKGHNGRAVYLARVTANDKLISLELKQSSGSAAIDAAVRARAETLWYRAGTDAAGNPVESLIPVNMEYARYDWKSPGGGVDSYTCGDLVREFDWYSTVDPAPQHRFLPQVIFLELPVWVRVEQRASLPETIVTAEIARQAEMWPVLIERCRKTPERLMLDEIDHSETFKRRMVQY